MPKPVAVLLSVVVAAVLALSSCAGAATATIQTGGLATPSPTLAGAPAQTAGGATGAVIGVGIAGSLLFVVVLGVCLFLAKREYDKEGNLYP